MFSLRMKLNDVIGKDEQVILENIRRCQLFSGKEFKVIFRNDGLSLKECEDTDYFEKGVEIAISKGLIINPLDINDMFYTEVDFEKDLNYAIRFLNGDKKIYE